MIYEHLQAIVVTAGSNKVLSPICGRELIVYPITLLASMHLPTTIVVDQDKDTLRSLLTHHVGDTITYVTQEKQQDAWYQDHVLIMDGNMPLVTSDIIQELYTQHLQTEAAITHANYADIYIAQRTLLELYAQENPASTPYACTSLVTYATSHGYKITSVNMPAGDRLRIVHTLADLAAAEQIKRAEIINQWMDKGVHFPFAQTVHIDMTTTLGSGTTIGAGVHIKGATHIGSNCAVHEYSIIDNSIIGDDVRILPHSVITNSHLDSQVQVGPFAHIKEQSHIQEHAIIGNFVEVKKTTVGQHTKAKHLSYLGNATIGSHVNIGAGTITCNHNGVSKQKTIIENNAYIGVNNTLIAPVTIGENAFTAGGSVITEDVPADALAIGRARQVIKEGYANKLRGGLPQEIVPQEELTSFTAATKTNNTRSENT